MAPDFLFTAALFFLFNAAVAFFTWYKLRKDSLQSSTGYFLGGRSLTGIFIAGSMLLTNVSSEHLIGMNGSAYRNGMIVIAWEVTSAVALVIAALYFIPKYLKMGLTTIPEFLESRFDGPTRTMVSLFLLLSFVVTLLPIVLYSGAIGLESLFDVSRLLGISKGAGLWLMVVMIGVIGSVYAIFGGLKAVAYSDTLNGIGLLVGGLLVPVLALLAIGNNNPWTGLQRVYQTAPEKFNVIGAPGSVLPFGTLFTGLIINQLYFWGMNQTIIQRALGAKNLEEAQKGLLLTGVFKVLIPLVIILPGIICFYYFRETFYADQDAVYPELVKRVVPFWLIGFFAAVVMGAVLSTFNSVLNSAATLFSVDIYKRHLNRQANERKLVRMGKGASALLALAAIVAAPMVADAPAGLYQLLQQLNGIFFIPIASILLAGFFFKKVSAAGAKAALLAGLLFYILATFVYTDHGIHFVHIWGIEFLLNVAIMYGVSWFFPQKDNFQVRDVGAVDLTPWRYTVPLAVALCVVTVAVYLLLGRG